MTGIVALEHCHFTHDSRRDMILDFLFSFSFVFVRYFLRVRSGLLIQHSIRFLNLLFLFIHKYTRTCADGRGSYSNALLTE